MKLTDKEKIAPTIIYILICILLFFDLKADFESGSSLMHIAQEAVIFFLALVGIVILWLKYFFYKKISTKLKSSLTSTQKDLQKYKDSTKQLTEGLSLKIDEQLKTWRLTKSESEVALLLLKGLSSKDIANIRSIQEKTVRAQCSAIYKKSHLSNKHELSAFFLEDLLVIREE